MIKRYLKAFRNKVLIPLKVIPREGLSNEKIAFSLTIGIISGFFPVIGLTTSIGLALLLVLRQNFAIGQSVNWLLAPLHLLMIIPFMRLGSIITGHNAVTITLKQIIRAFEPGIWSGLKTVGIMHLYGIIAWSIIAIPAGLIVYFLSMGLLRFMQKRKPVTVPVNSR